MARDDYIHDPRYQPSPGAVTTHNFSLRGAPRPTQGKDTPGEDPLPIVAVLEMFRHDLDDIAGRLTHIAECMATIAKDVEKRAGHWEEKT
jgi:hypothetical protein